MAQDGITLFAGEVVVVRQRDVVVETTDFGEMEEWIGSVLTPVGLCVGRAIRLVEVEYHAGGVDAGLGLDHQAFARRAGA